MIKMLPYLKTVKNFAGKYPRKGGGTGVVPTYIYRMLKYGKLSGVEIDGVIFIDTRKEYQAKES